MSIFNKDFQEEEICIVTVYLCTHTATFYLCRVNLLSFIDLDVEVKVVPRSLGGKF